MIVCNWCLQNMIDGPDLEDVDVTGLVEEGVRSCRVDLGVLLGVVRLEGEEPDRMGLVGALCPNHLGLLVGELEKLAVEAGMRVSTMPILKDLAKEAREGGGGVI